MKRLIIVCEGPTEQEFCTEVLGVEFAKHDIYVEAPVIKHSHGGIVPWTTIKKQILNHLQEGDVYVSMLVDYYGIKDQFGFPGWEESKEIVDKTERIHFLIDRMAKDISEQYRFRFIPYIQLHEFEGLLFSDVSAFLNSFEESEFDYAELQATAEAFQSPFERGITVPSPTDNVKLKMNAINKLTSNAENTAIFMFLSFNIISINYKLNNCINLSNTGLKPSIHSLPKER